MVTANPKFPENYGDLEPLSASPRSSTYRGVHPEQGGSVFVKVLHFGREDASGVFGRVFLDRCEVLSQLAHPYMPTLYEAEILADGDGWMVGEWIGGTPLTELAPQPPMQALPLLLQVLEALECLALHNLVHWNLTLDNLRLDDKGAARLVGLGVSLLPLEWWYLCRAGLRDDSIAPELRVPGAGPVPTVGGAWWRCDLYSFGYAAARLLGAKVSGAGSAAPSVATQPGVDTPIDQVLARCLNGDPNRRPNSFAEVMRSLQHSFQRRPRSATADDDRDTGRFGLREAKTETTQPMEVATASGAAAEPTPAAPAPGGSPAATDETALLGPLVEGERTVIVEADSGRVTQPTEPAPAPEPAAPPALISGATAILPLAESTPAAPAVPAAPVAPAALVAPVTGPLAHSPQKKTSPHVPPAKVPGPSAVPPPVAVSAALASRPAAGSLGAISTSVPLSASAPANAARRRRPGWRWLAAAAVVIAVAVLAALLARPKPAPPAPPPAVAPARALAPPLPPPMPIELVLALELHADGDADGAREQLRRLRARSGLVGLPSQHCDAVLSLEEVLERERVATQALALRRAVEGGQLDALRGAMGAIGDDEDRLRVQTDAGQWIDRGRAVLARLERFDLEVRRGGWGSAFELAAGMERDYPSIERAAALRERAAKGFERQIELLFARGDTEQANAALAELRRLWPGRRGLERFDQRFEQQATTRQRYDDTLDEAERLLERGRPHEGAALLRAEEPPFAYAKRFADSIERLDAEFVRRDAQAPTVRGDESHVLEFRRGQPLVIKLLITDDYEVTEVVFFGRIGDAPRYRTFELKALGGDRYQLVIDATVHLDETFSYFALARDRSGHEGRLGSEAAPIELRRRRWFRPG